jgi:tetratricopeptide (TPR) repeat protein
LTAPKADKAAWRVIVGQGPPTVQALEQLMQDHPTPHGPLAAFLAAGQYAQGGDLDRARQLLAYAHGANGHPTGLSGSAFVRNYISASTLSIQVAAGVTAEVPLSDEAVSLVYAEVLQDLGELGEATAVVEAMVPTSVAAVSLADLYAAGERAEEVVDLTNNLRNEDDATALLLAFRGQALRRLGLLDASIEALKEALRVRSRPVEIRHFALSERAETYAAKNRLAQARKDLERILAEDASNQAVHARLAELKAV